MKGHSLYLPEHNAHLRYYRAPGQQPARIYLNGLGGESLVSFLHIVTHPALADRETLLVDFLGFSLSDPAEDFDYSLVSHARSVAFLLDRIDIAGCEVVGYSLGGSVAIVLAAMRPDLVSQLVVAEGNLDPGIGTMSVRIATQTPDEYLGEGHQAEVRRFRSNLPLFAGVVAIANPLAMYWTARGLYEGTTPTMREHFQSLSMSRTFIAGEKSLPNSGWEQLNHADIPLLVVPDTGHMFTSDNPNGFAEAIALAFRRPSGAT